VMPLSGWGVTWENSRNVIHTYEMKFKLSACVMDEPDLGLFIHPPGLRALFVAFEQKPDLDII
jgi:hypothetical protein